MPSLTGNGSGNACVHRTPSTIYELDELDCDEESEPLNPNDDGLNSEADRKSSRQKHVRISAPEMVSVDEADGPNDSKKPTNLTLRIDRDDDQSGIPKKNGQSKSFERLILDLMTPTSAKIRVFLPDNTGVDFLSSTGYVCKCSEIIDCVSRNLLLDSQHAQKVLSVWFTDGRGNLEIQLKPHHNPFAIQKNWNYYMDKFTGVEYFEQHPPIVRVKRSAWLSLEDEKKIAGRSGPLRHLLFHDAKQAFVSGRYVFGHEETIQLVALLLYKEHGIFSLSPRNLAAIRGSLESLCPPGFLPKSILSFKRSNKREAVVNRILNVYQEIPNSAAEGIMERFLEICWKNPLYGAVFFNGFIERPSSAPSLRSVFGSARGSHRQTRLAVNDAGIFVVALHGGLIPEVLLAAAHGKYDYECFEPPFSSGSEEKDDPILIFTMSVHNKESDSESVLDDRKSFAVLSRQAPLISACISTFSHLHRTRQFPTNVEVQTEGDVVEGDIQRSPLIRMKEHLGRDDLRLKNLFVNQFDKLRFHDFGI